MATLIARKSINGKTLWTVQFVLGRRRPCMPLGHINKAQELRLKGYIESLVACRRSNHAMDGKTASWLADVDDDFYAILVDRGLCEPRQTVEPSAPAEKPKLGPFLKSYIQERSDVKANTTTVYGHTHRCLTEFFGSDKPLDEITVADASDWRRWLARPTKEWVRDSRKTRFGDGAVSPNNSSATPWTAN